MTPAPGSEGQPLLTVVVPTYNSQATLAEALRSLADQIEHDFEVVISDGASTDDTLRLARSFTPALPDLRVLSRPDRGVYDAVNQGIIDAQGQWILVLGSDDRLHAPDTLKRVFSTLRETQAAIVYGDVRMMNENARGVLKGGRYAGPMPLEKLLRANICQQSVFYRRTLFDELGLFDLEYPVMADWDFNVRAAFCVPMLWVDVIVADYAATGLSAQHKDEAAMRGIPEWIRLELLRRSGDCNLWPHHRILLRQADQLRRQGQWRLAFRQWATFARLMSRRALVGARDR